MSRSVRSTVLAFASVGVLALGACGGSEGTTPSASGGAGGGGAKGSSQVISAIFSGPTNDADYNALGLAALKAAEGKGAKISFTEKVAVPDIEARLNEAVGEGSTVIWTHGSQFYAATAKVAEANPEIAFIAEYDGKPDKQPANVWIIDREFHLGFYSMGVLAANLTKTGTVGYVGGLSLPFAFSEVHAMEQAFKDSGKTVNLKPVFTGDFNDAAKAQQFTTQLLGSGADVIVGSLNQGATGTFQAFSGRPDGDGWVTAKYTDKSASAGSHYAASLEYDFVGPLGEILGKIASGTTTGHYGMGQQSGVKIGYSSKVPAEAKAAAEKAFADVKSGAVTVELNTAKVG